MRQVAAKLLEAMGSLGLVASTPCANRRVARTAPLAGRPFLASPSAPIREIAAKLARAIPTTEAVTGAFTKTKDPDPTASDEASEPLAVERPLAEAGLPKAP